MPSRNSKTPFPALLLLFSLAAFCACAHHEAQKLQQMTEQPPRAMAFTAPTPSGPPDLRPPQPAEAQDAVRRVYGRSVIVESGHPQYFTAGDLNGDGSPDIAVMVRPAPGQLTELNNEVANWIRCDPTKVKPSKPQKHGRIMLQMVEPTVIEAHDLLLAVIHGYGPQGWRSPDARQSYLLKNAAGSEIKLVPVAEAIKLAKNNRDLPLPRGDMIKQTLGSDHGLLYYTGAKYAWQSSGTTGL
jgi:hypothetical protein